MAISGGKYGMMVDGLDDVLRNLNRQIEGIQGRSVKGLVKAGFQGDPPWPE